jgi:hypothetical protein
MGELQQYLKYIYYVLLVSGFLILLIWRKKLDTLFLYFFPLYFFILLTQTASDILVTYGLNTYQYYHINQFIGAFLLNAYYFSLLDKKSNKRIVVIGFTIFISYFFYHFLYRIENIFNSDFSDFALEGVFICIYVILYLLELYRKDDFVTLNETPNFWISVGNLIFFSGCIFVMGFSSYIIKNYSKLFYVNYFLNLLLYSLYIKAFLCNLKTRK